LIKRIIKSRKSRIKKKKNKLGLKRLKSLSFFKKVIAKKRKIVKKKRKYIKALNFGQIIKIVPSFFRKEKRKKKKRINKAFLRLIYRLYLLQRLPSVIISHGFSWIKFYIQ